LHTRRLFLILNVMEIKVHHVIASDTDSAYFTLTKLIQKLYPDSDSWPREKRIEALLKITDKIQERANTNLNQISHQFFNIQSKHHFVLKQEVIAEKAYWSGKRRYAMYIVNKEGIPIEELEMKGMDIMKSNFPPLFRNFGENLIKNILFGKPKEEIDKDVMEFKKMVGEIEWINLLKPTGLKKMGEYIERKPMAGDLFSKLKLKCPINTKAAIIYNDFLRYKNLTIKYPEFTIGDKMYIAYLKSNPYQIDVIGYNGYNDPPEITGLINKYIDRDGLFDGIMRNKLENLYSDLKWDFNLNPFKAKFFTFN
jgi:hypothetical protein